MWGQAGELCIQAADLQVLLGDAREVAQDDEHRQEVTLDYLNKLERGTATFSRALLEVREAIRAVLGYSPEKWQELTGLYVPAAGAEPELRVSPQVKPPYQALPQGLQAAVDIYGKRFDDLRDPRWQQYLAGFRWREGEPEDPEAWLDLYRDLTRAEVVPREN